MLRHNATEVLPCIQNVSLRPALLRRQMHRTPRTQLLTFADVLAQDFNKPEVGRRIILPCSYTMGDRFMQQLCLVSMAIVRPFGHPTLFITFTTNSNSKAIVDELLPGQTAVDQSHLVARVFHIQQ